MRVASVNNTDWHEAAPAARRGFATGKGRPSRRWYCQLHSFPSDQRPYPPGQPVPWTLGEGACPRQLGLLGSRVGVDQAADESSSASGLVEHLAEAACCHIVVCHGAQAHGADEHHASADLADNVKPVTWLGAPAVADNLPVRVSELRVAAVGK